MKFTAAFQALGYKLPNAQGFWSAERADGVCITLWQRELATDDQKRPTMRAENFGPVEGWMHRPANKHRKKHIQRALDEFGGYVDVVILLGPPGERYGDAFPWDASRPGRWRVTKLYDTGQFDAELVI